MEYSIRFTILLMTVPATDVVKKAAKSSCNNHNSKWQDFKSTQAFDVLNKKFPTN